MDPHAAGSLAESFLADALPQRWVHVRTVGLRAEALAGHFEDGQLLAVAAWLHDLGYAPDLATHRFHPLDGARALHARGGSSRLCGLVGFHSAASYEAEELGLLGELRAEFSDEASLVRDLLWYLDMTTGPDGRVVTFEDRMAEVRDRYPDDHYVIRALGAGMTERQSAVERSQSWLAHSGLAGQV